MTKEEDPEKKATLTIRWTDYAAANLAARVAKFRKPDQFVEIDGRTGAIQFLRGLVQGELHAAVSVCPDRITGTPGGPRHPSLEACAGGQHRVLLHVGAVALLSGRLEVTPDGKGTSIALVLPRSRGCRPRGLPRYLRSSLRPDFKIRNFTYDSGGTQSIKSSASDARSAAYRVQKWGVSGARQINRAPRLGVRGAPNLEAIPSQIS